MKMVVGLSSDVGGELVLQPASFKTKITPESMRDISVGCGSVEEHETNKTA